MAELSGNLLVSQSGGPTAVINSSLAGVIQEAGRHEFIEEIYGGLNGVLGILNEDLIDLNNELARSIEGLKYTPGAALGTCRYKIKFPEKPEDTSPDLDRLFQVFEAHNIRYFFYIGGNDSQDTAHKIHLEAARRGYEVRVMGVPKTIDNDLPHTDSCPGYGSVTKFNAASIQEIGLDVGGMATDDGSCCIVEVMGRSAGWIAAGTVLAKRGRPERPPHIILMPEVPFEADAFIAKVRSVVDSLKYCIVVCGEGLKNAQGKEIGVDKSRLDAFGHPLLSGAAEHLSGIVQEKLDLKVRTVRYGYAQRGAAHFASAIDSEQAAACGTFAVRKAVEGDSGYMSKIVRIQNKPYQWRIDFQSLADIANQVHFIPRDWISDDGFLPNEKFIEYVEPLVEGEVKPPLENGLPKYVELEKSPVEKKLSARVEPEERAQPVAG